LPVVWGCLVTRAIAVASVPLRCDPLASALDEREFDVEAHLPTDLEPALQWHRPELVVVDMPPPAGLALVGHLAARNPPILAVAMAVPDDEDEIVSWIEAGASAYSSVKDSLDDLIGTLHRVIEGEAEASPRAIAALMRKRGAALDLGT
jgi:DNA-binding NarL/FixJ family response regulator